MSSMVISSPRITSRCRLTSLNWCSRCECIIELSAKRASLQGLMDELYAELIENFARFDAGGGPEPDRLFAELKGILSKIAYLRTLLRDVDRELNTAEAE